MFFRLKIVLVDEISRAYQLRKKRNLIKILQNIGHLLSRHPRRAQCVMLET